MSLRHYFFKPKPFEPLKLVIVVASDAENIGRGSDLAKLLKLKDLRAADDALVSEVLSKSKSDATILDVTLNHAEAVLVAISASLQDEAIRSHLASSHVKFQELAFGEKGAAPYVSRGYSRAGFEGVESSPTPVAKEAKPATTPTAPSEGLENPGLTIKKDSDDFGSWYQQVLTRAEMIDYYDISGCYVLRPASFYVWEQIQGFFDKEIKKLGVENAYFPMFVSQKVLEKEKDHIEGFAAEVAWVTKAGSSDLEEPIAIRPTSETVMYPAYAKWIRSYRDLPLKLNQWNSVVRWEFKNPQPFLRTREFLWQEGHTAHLYRDSADKEVRDILDLYRQVYEDLLAVPVIPGIKSEKEKFAGGLYTTTVEGFVPSSGRGIQGGTSHCLGQNFSKMFNISVEDPNNPGGDKLLVWQNSWGLSTRTIGVMVMVHSDDKGLVLPPRVAQWQVVVVPTGIGAKTTPEARKDIYAKSEAMVAELLQASIKSRVDLREGYTPGYKYNDWEMRGVPLRLELGPNDIAKGQATAVRRDTGVKTAIALNDLVTGVKNLLNTIQADLFAAAKKDYEDHLKVITDWKDFVPSLNGKNVCVVPWCEVEACEDDIKDQSAKESAAVQDERAPSAGAKSLCIPFDQERWGQLPEKCIKCGSKALRWTMFGRSY